MRVASVNIYVANKQLQADLKRLKSLGLVAIGMQETHKRYADIVKGLSDTFDEYSADRDSAGGRAPQDCTIFLHKKATYLGHGAYQVSEQVGDSGIAAARWLVWVRFQWNGHKYALLNVHLNAAIQNRKTGAPLTGIERVRQYRLSAAEVEEEIASQQQDGYNVIVVGDFNYRRYRIANFTLWKWSPQEIFRRRGLKYIEKGLDYVAWTPTLEQRKFDEIPTSQTGSDHPWLVVNLRPKQV